MSSVVEPPVPDCDNEVRVAHGQGAREVDSAGDSQRVRSRQLARMLLYGSTEFNGTGSGPVAGPLLLGFVQVVSREVMIAGSSRPHFRIGQAARHRRVASVPQFCGEIACRFLGQQLHERAGVEIDQRHQSAPLVAADLGQWPARPRARSSRRSRAMRGRGPAYDAHGGQALEGTGSRETQEPGHRDTAFSDHQFGSAAGPFEPLAEMGPEFSNSYVHAPSVHFASHQSVRKSAESATGDLVAGEPQSDVPACRPPFAGRKPGHRMQPSCPPGGTRSAGSRRPDREVPMKLTRTRALQAGIPAAVVIIGCGAGLALAAPSDHAGHHAAVASPSARPAAATSPPASTPAPAPVPPASATPVAIGSNGGSSPAASAVPSAAPGAVASPVPSAVASPVPRAAPSTVPAAVAAPSARSGR
jgi:hypothetical protein